MDNWGHKIVPKHLLFVICWQFNQLSCLSSSIFNRSPSKNATPSFVWEGCLHSAMPFPILSFLLFFISLPPALFSYDTSEMVPIATPVSDSRGKRLQSPPSTQRWQCQSSQQQLLLLRSLHAPPWSCFPPVALTEIQRLAFNDLSLV